MLKAQLLRHLSTQYSNYVNFRSVSKIAIIKSLWLIAMLVFADCATTLWLKDKTTARKISASYHHGLLPDSILESEWIKGDLIVEKTNRFGFRSTNSDRDVQELSQYKTVVVGDSFTEGVGLRANETFASLLPPELNPVANMGVVSYSPSIYFNKL